MKQKRCIHIGETPIYLLSYSGFQLSKKIIKVKEDISLPGNTELGQKWRLLLYIGDLEDTGNQNCGIQSSQLEGSGHGGFSWILP